MACEIPDNPMSSCPEQHEVVAIDFSGADTVAVGEQLPDRTTVSAPAIRLYRLLKCSKLILRVFQI